VPLPPPPEDALGVPLPLPDGAAPEDDGECDAEAQGDAVVREVAEGGGEGDAVGGGEAVAGGLGDEEGEGDAPFARDAVPPPPALALAQGEGWPLPVGDPLPLANVLEGTGEAVEVTEPTAVVEPLRELAPDGDTAGVAVLLV
jgi:hypothetical protein